MPYIEGQWIPTTNSDDAIPALSNLEVDFKAASMTARDITTQFREYEKSLGPAAPTFEEYMAGNRDAYLGRLGAADQAKPMVEQFREAALDEARKGNTDFAWQSKEAEPQDRMAEVSAGLKKGLEEGKAELAQIGADDEDSLPLPGEAFGSYIERQILVDQIKANRERDVQSWPNEEVRNAVEQLQANYAESLQAGDELDADEQFTSDLESAATDPESFSRGVDTYFAEAGIEDAVAQDAIMELASEYVSPDSTASEIIEALNLAAYEVLGDEDVD